MGTDNIPTTRRLGIDQALANTRIEGHQPTPEFLADCEAYAVGQLTPAQAVAHALARARELSTTAGPVLPEVGGDGGFR